MLKHTDIYTQVNDQELKERSIMLQQITHLNVLDWAYQSQGLNGGRTVTGF